MNLDKSSAFNHICIAGIGGVGGFYGGIIALNITNNFRDKRDVTFIARGAHLEAIKKNGLTLNLWECDPVKCVPNVVTDKITDLTYINLLIIAVKGYDLEPVMEFLKDKISSDTVILPLMNGIGNEKKIREITPKGIILPACVYISAKIEKPGVVTLQGDISRIIAGPDPDNSDYDSNEIKEFFKKMGLKFIWNENPQLAIWKKYMFIAPAALITGANNVTIRGISENPTLKDDFYSIAGEIRAIAVANGIILPKEAEDDCFKIAENIDKDAKTSFQLDLENGKEQTEIDAFGYKIVRLGKEANIPTPVTERVLAEIVK